MTGASSTRRERRLDGGTWRSSRWALIVLACALLMLVIWVGIRGLMAKGELEAAIPLVAKMQSQVLNEEMGGVAKTASALDGHTAAAVSLTGDPVWRLAEQIPWVGPNLVAFRELAAVADGLSENAVGPLTELVEVIGVEDLKPVGGVFNVQALEEARPYLARADRAVAAAEKATGSIEADHVVEQIRAARGRLEDQLAMIAEPLDALHLVSVLAPDMLGSSGPRNFLLLFQNPAELRASGGIPGAAALLKAESGRITLLQQASTADFPPFESPVLPLDEATRGLYGDITGLYLQNVNLTPRFPLSAELAREMWKQRFGTEVEVVLSVDPVSLSYILEATGPIVLATGDVLSADNALTLLLRDAYVKYSDPAYQDAFFAGAAAAVFERVAGGQLDARKLVTALAKSGSERRVSIWSAIASEQEALVGTGLTGELPIARDSSQPFGVYLNDATASKMDFYLDVQVAAGQVTCRNDDRPNYGIAVTLTNTAPSNAAEVFPAYVTGGGTFGVPPGNIKTLVNVYGAPELQNLGVTRDGDTVPYLPATDSGYQVSQISLELAPGQSATLQFGFLGSSPFDGEIVIEQTPVINRYETKKLALSCESPLW